MYNRPNGQTSMASVQGPIRHLGTQNRPRQTDRQLLEQVNYIAMHRTLKAEVKHFKGSTYSLT
jgi:hypothetical protein